MKNIIRYVHYIFGTSGLCLLLYLLMHPIIDNERETRNTSQGKIIRENAYYFDKEGIEAALPNISNDNLEYLTQYNFTEPPSTRSLYVPIGRGVPVTYVKDCLERKQYTTNQYRVSVIIVFHDVLWTDLLRCLVSIIYRSSSELQEVILIDDGSTLKNLKTPLDLLITSLYVPNIKIYRLSEHHGESFARYYGAQHSSGDVLMFINAQSEVNYNWLTPLIDTLITYDATIAVPVNDLIDDKTLKYNVIRLVSRGSFTWNLKYINHYSSENRNKVIEPYESSTMSGIAYMTRRTTFFRLVSTDDTHLVSDLFNLQLSFKTWLSNETILVSPCSHIGHFEDPKIFGSNLDSNTFWKDSNKVADVWMGKYSKLYYAATGNTKSLVKKGEHLHSFGWFLDKFGFNHYLTKDYLKTKYFGQLYIFEFCVTIVSKRLVLQECFFHKREQYLEYDTSLHIVTYRNECLKEKNNQLYISSCSSTDASHQWKLERIKNKFLVRSLQKNICFSMTDGYSLRLQPCNFTNNNQHCEFTYTMHDIT